MRSHQVRKGALRHFSLIAAAMSFVAVMSGCGGDGVQLAQQEDVRTLAGVTGDHGLDPGSRITVQPGMAEDHGNVTINCPAGTPACEVVVAADGSVGYNSAGGMPAILPRLAAPESIEALLHGRLLASTWPVAVSFGGGVATCQALGCPVADAIHVDQPAVGGAGHPTDNHQPDLAGFEPLDPRQGISRARKARTVVEGELSAFHRSFGAWMDHGFFLVETYMMPLDAGSRYHTTWFGNATHSDSLTAPGNTATWSGIMTGVESSPANGSGAFVHGDSAITVSGLAARAGVGISVDVAFTNIVNEDTGASIRDMTWHGLPLQGREFGTDNVLFSDGFGYFRDESFGAAAEGSLYGRLYGPGHEEVAGLFHSNGIAGAFAGKRDQ